MLYCKICGAMLDPTDKFCTNCGTPTGLMAAADTEEVKPEKSAIDWPDKDKTEPSKAAKGTDTDTPDPEAGLPEEYKPLGMWTYFGYEVLFAIPCVGVVFLLVFVFGGTNNVNLRNFARSHFCFAVLMCIIAVLGVTLFALWDGVFGFFGIL